jgi:hypothetical protein
VYIGTASGAETLQGSFTSGTFQQSAPLAAGSALPASNSTVCSLHFNDEGIPYVGYKVALTTTTGQFYPGFPQKWRLNGGANGNINVSSGLPVWDGSVVYPTPILSTPLNHGLQSISGPLDLGGYAIQNLGPIILPSNLSVPVGTAEFYGDQFCTTLGTYDDSCLRNAVAAHPSNAKIILAAHTYNFASKVIATGLTNVWIEGSGPGTIITSNGTAFECDNCTGGGFADMQMNSSVTPTVISCFLIPSSRTMSCPALPTTPSTQVIVLDPWGQGVGHIPTSTDTILLPPSSLSSTQINENFDTGVFYYKPTGVHITGISGTYTHIVLTDAVNSVVANNNIMGGNGSADTNRGSVHLDRCGGICLWFSTAQAPGIFSNLNNVISNNVVSFSASEGIDVSHADGTLVVGNTVSYGGESGIFTGQGHRPPSPAFRQWREWRQDRRS